MQQPFYLLENNFVTNAKMHAEWLLLSYTPIANNQEI
jgi:hypothetical protein